MKAKFHVVNPEKILATMTVTMAIEEWEALASQLVDKWPSWQFSSLVRSVVSQARTHFESEQERTS